MATPTEVQLELLAGTVLSQGRRHCPLLGDAVHAWAYVVRSNVAVERQENISFETS